MAKGFTTTNFGGGAKGSSSLKGPSAPKFKSRFKTGFVSKYGKTPKIPGPPRKPAQGKIGVPKFNKLGGS